MKQDWAASATGNPTTQSWRNSTCRMSTHTSNCVIRRAGRHFSTQSPNTFYCPRS